MKKNPYSKVRKPGRCCFTGLTKEIMFKCMNASDVDFREHLHVMPFTPDEQGVFSAAEYRTAEKQIFQIYYYLFSDFVLTLSL